MSGEGRWRRRRVSQSLSPQNLWRTHRATSHLSALRPLQDPRTTDPQSCRSNSRPLAFKGTGWISTQKVYRRSGGFAYAKH